MFEAHFQTFEDPKAGVALTARLSAFREELARRKLTGFVIPRADQQQNEYVAPSEERLAWLTGFTGSAGMAIVLTQEAAVFVDGRYTLQAAKQVDHKGLAVSSRWPIRRRKTGWRSILSAGDRLGFDPWLHTSAAAERLAAACAKAGAELVAVDSNPLDSVWTERPPRRSARSPFTARNFPAKRKPKNCSGSALEIARPRRRRAGAVGFARGGLDLQHPRRRRLAYAAAAVLRAGAEGRPAHGVHRSPQTFQQRPRPSRTVGRRRGAGCADAKTHRAGESAARRSRSTTRPPPTR